MQIKELFTDDDAVSPVIGVILMVAITVILAAVIAALVLGLGDEPQETPQAQWEFDYDGTSLEITHNGGDNIDSSEIQIRGTATTGGSGNPLPLGWWEAATPSGYSGSNFTVSTGNTSTIGGSSNTLANDYDITVTWVPPGGGDTAPLSSDSGPGA